MKINQKGYSAIDLILIFIILADLAAIFVISGYKIKENQVEIEESNCKTIRLLEKNHGSRANSSI